MTGEQRVERIGAGGVVVVVVEPGQQGLDIAERPANAVAGERGTSRHRNIVLTGHGGEHPQVLAQIEDVVLRRVNVGEVGIGTGHQLELCRGIRAKHFGAADGERGVEFIGLAAGGREVSQRCRAERNIKRNADSLRRLRVCGVLIIYIWILRD